MIFFLTYVILSEELFHQAIHNQNGFTAQYLIKCFGEFYVSEEKLIQE